MIGLITLLFSALSCLIRPGRGNEHASVEAAKRDPKRGWKMDMTS